MGKRKDVFIDQVYLRELSANTGLLFTEPAKKVNPDDLGESVLRTLEKWAKAGNRFAILKVLVRDDFTRDVSDRIENDLVGEAKEIYYFCLKHHLKARVLPFAYAGDISITALVAEW